MSDREIARLYKSDEELGLNHVKWAESQKLFFEQGIVMNLKVSILSNFPILNYGVLIPKDLYLGNFSHC